MQNLQPDHYAVLGLDTECTDDQIRAAYRILSKKFHPDLNPDPATDERIRALNAAYEVLGESESRAAYDRSRKASAHARTRGTQAARRNLTEDAHLKIEELLRGTCLEVKVNDHGNPEGSERYDLTVPPGTAPGERFRVPRNQGGFVIVRVKVFPHLRFKVRGSDLRCDLRITARRAAQGGPEMVAGATGSMIRVPIVPGVARGEVIRIPGEGLPRLRGGRGDLLVRIDYRPEVKITARR